MEQSRRDRIAWQLAVVADLRDSVTGYSVSHRVAEAADKIRQAQQLLMSCKPKFDQHFGEETPSEDELFAFAKMLGEAKEVRAIHH
ncbi:MAG: hypothetical protein M3Q73_02180 [bacterium]|nr:hypothetical protein [bacterium]